jgi:hypothetical protein
MVFLLFMFSSERIYVRGKLMQLHVLRSNCGSDTDLCKYMGLCCCKLSKAGNKCWPCPVYLLSHKSNKPGVLIVFKRHVFITKKTLFFLLDGAGFTR